MRDKKPYSLKQTIVVYNITQILMSVFLVYEVSTKLILKFKFFPTYIPFRVDLSFAETEDKDYKRLSFVFKITNSYILIFLIYYFPCSIYIYMF